MVPSGYTTSA
jgi:hypothetical protein